MEAGEAADAKAAGEDRPTLVPEIDLEALAKLGPEAFAHRQKAPSADLMALAASPEASVARSQMPEYARSLTPLVPMPAQTTKALNGDSTHPPGKVAQELAQELALELDMFELDSIDVAFDDVRKRSMPPEPPTKPDLDIEEERPTSRPPSGPRAPAPLTDDFFNDLDDPSDLGAMTEPPAEAAPTDIPPTPEDQGSGRSVDDLFADMIDEPFPPSMDSMRLQQQQERDAAAVPAPEASSDEIYDADADEAMAKLRERFEAKDYPGALHLAETLTGDALHADEVAEISARCRSAMQARYVERIGSLTKVPVISVPMSVILDLPIDNRAGFLLSRIDGVSSLEMILDMCGMSELDALRIVYDLVQNGALEFI